MKPDGSWIQTFSRKQFWPLDPKAVDVDIVDIAHALSHLCRFSGHCEDFYSVAQHSVMGATVGLDGSGLTRPIPKALRLAFLLHDASEAYIVDVPRPIKPALLGYRELESKVQGAVWERFEMPPAFQDHPMLKEIDNRMLATEMRDIMGPPPAPWSLDAEPFSSFKIVSWSPSQAKERFLATFAELSGLTTT